jgi:acetolactate synthase I/III small subunit
MSPQRNKILIAYVHDKPGVLTKLASIFYRRGINIRTLTVAGTANAEISKIVFRVEGDHGEVNRLMLSVANLIDVISAEVKDDTGYTARELCVARVKTAGVLQQVSVLSAIAPFGAKIVQREDDSCVFEIVDAPERIDAFIKVLKQFELIDLSRTGATAIPGMVSVQLTATDDNDQVIDLPKVNSL